MTQQPFVHLHTHSHFSLLQALPKIPELVTAAKEDGMQALALTDAGNLYGAIPFYKECTKQGIKPIIGVDAYVSVRTRFDKEPKVDSKRHRLVLLAENITGYKNLLSLVTKSFTEGFYYKPRVDHALLSEYKDGLIAILPSYSSETSALLRVKNDARAREMLARYKELFGPSQVFLEITKHPEIEGHDALMQAVAKLSKEEDVPTVAGHDIYYISPEDRLARETLLKVQTQGEIRDTSLDDEEDFSFKSSKEMHERFSDMPEALKEAVSIAERCTVELSLGEWIFPQIDIPEGTDYDSELRRITYEGLSERNMKKTKEVTDRIDYELQIIKDKGFSPYFLAVADLLSYARKNNILTNTRGSAAGSLVSYLNGITNIDPLEYKLPFERFLNPERPKAPDIDMDFADDRRDEVIHYAKEKYGEDRVAQIGTFGTMMARGSVRDTARALGYPYTTGDMIAKLIPFGMQGFPMSIDTALEDVSELKALYTKDADVKRIIDLAKKIEGCARHISVHAAGVVISPTPLVEWAPLQYDPKGGKLITQYDMYSISDEYGGVGLLKFDFLGIKNLSILADSVSRVQDIKGIEIDVERIPLDDGKTFEMLASGKTMGLFQLGGSGMTRYLMELKPSSIHDINAMVALYRPGPMDVIPDYIKRKNNPSLVRYPDPRMEEYLEASYGLIVYQDDLLFSAIELAGYSWLDADNFRKAIGKKIPAEMAAQKEKFVSGVVENGRDKAFAEKMWKLFEPFAAYGFNKAHAASYGRLAYQTAYMKANYPAEYMASLLTADSGDTDKIAEAIAECGRLSIPVLPPDVNESFGDFTVVEDNLKEGGQAIRFGLFSVKNVGEGVAQAIIDERLRGGPFSSIAEFLSRTSTHTLNRRALESLIKCGAFDSLEGRGILMHNIERLLAFVKEQSTTPEGQDSLFTGTSAEGPALSLTKEGELSRKEQLAWERELLGVFVSGHPLDEHKEKLSKQKFEIAQLEDELREGMNTVICGLVEDAREILTKKGDRMVFFKLADLSGSIEVVAFPRVLSEYKDALSVNNCVAIKGRLSKRNGTASIVAEAAKVL